MSDLENYLEELLELGQRIDLLGTVTGDRLAGTLADRLLDTCSLYQRLLEHERARPRGVVSGEIG